MYCIIGGSQSSGTSLLRQILNRHADVHCLNESHIFCKPELYENWEKHKNKLFSRGLLALTSSGWRIMNGLNYEQNPFDKDQLKATIKKSKSMQDFMTSLFDSVSNSAIYMDKTPANIFCVPAFLNSFEKSKAIICVRNPYDSICSMLARGFTLLDAICIVKSTLKALHACIPNKDILTVRYEDLVSQSKEEVERICNFLSVKFYPTMLEKQKLPADEITKIEGWNYDENESIQSGSVGRFDKQSDEEKNRIAVAFRSIEWEKDEESIMGMLQFFEYIYLEKDIDASISKELSEAKRKALWERTRKMHNYSMFNDPIRILK